MKKYSLIAKYVRKAKKNNKSQRIEDNVKPNKGWDTDVTYLYIIIDLYDRHVFSHVISKHNDIQLLWILKKKMYMY